MKKRKDCIYYYYFEQTNSIYVGRTIQRTERNWQHIHCVKTDTVARYAYENGFQVPEMVIIEDNLTVEQGQKQECFWMNFYKTHGYNVLNRCKGGGIGGLGSGKLTKEYCMEEAREYKTKKEFEKGSNSAYHKSRENGWLDEMDWFDIKRKRWTYEECYEIAKQCQTKTEFQNTNNRAYQYALRKQWLKDYTWFENGYNITFGKKVIQLTKDGQFVAEYETAHEASRITGIARTNICGVCRGIKKSSHGYIWKYA